MGQAQRAIAFFWCGPANLSGTLKLEWRIVAARWFALLCVVPGLVLLPLTPQQVRATGLITWPDCSTTR